MPVSVLRLPSLPASAGKQHWGNLPGAALSLAVAEAASSAKRFTLLLTADSQNAERLEQELRFFAPDLPVLHFPDWETLPYDVFSPHQDIISQRIAALYQLPQLKHGVLVVPISTALHRLAPTRFLLGSSLVLDVGQKLDVERMRLRLEGAGYRCVDTVYEHGEFAVRGALIDLFPMGSELPFRIDLFDDEIETLRTFDPETQRSIDKVESIRLLPAREFPLNKEAVTGFRGRFREPFDVDYRRCPIYQDLASGLTPSGIEYYLPLFFEETATLFDYLPQDTQVFSLPGIEQAAEQFWNDVRSRYEDRRVDPERPLLPPAEVFLPVEDCFARLKNWPRVVASQEDVEPGVGRERFPALPLPNLAIEAKAAEPLAALRRFIEEFPGRVLFCAESAGRREVLLELLARLKLRPEEVDGWPAFLASQARLAISIAPLDEGLLLDQSISANLALGNLPALARHGVIDRRREEALARRQVEALRVRCADTAQAVGELSGGNQQKVVIGRWLERDCQVLLFDEPTRGIDVGAKFDIYALLAELTRRGKALVVVSSDLRELMLICDRIGVLSAGRMVDTFERDAWTQDALLAAAFAGYKKRDALLATS